MTTIIIICAVIAIMYAYGRTHRQYRVKKRSDGFVAERTGNVLWFRWRPVQYLDAIIFHWSEAEEIYRDVVFDTHKEAKEYIRQCKKYNKDVVPDKPLYTNDVVQGSHVIDGKDRAF